MSVSWQGQLEEASSEAEVVMTAKDFIARLTPAEIDRLPRECRPGKFFEANDVTSYAFSLMRHTSADVDEGAELLHTLAAFFSNASTRLSQIMARPNEIDFPETRESA
jgi:hypothetical protein